MILVSLHWVKVHAMRRKHYWVLLTVAVIVAAGVALSLRPSPPLRLAFLEGKEPKEDLQIPARLSGGSRTTYVFDRNYDEFLRAARAEMLGEGWMEVHSNHQASTFMKNDAHLTVLRGHISSLRHYVEAAKRRHETQSYNWELTSDCASVLIDRNASNPWHRVRGFVYDISGGRL